jgi:hypothetical protein
MLKPSARFEFLRSVVENGRTTAQVMTGRDFSEFEMHLNFLLKNASLSLSLSSPPFSLSLLYSG